MTLNQWLANTSKGLENARKETGRMAIKRKGLVCEDGLSLSVQASEFHYCEPQEIVENYSSVEVYSHGEIVKELEELGYHMEDEVYRFVNVNDLTEVIQVHGGIKES